MESIEQWIKILEQKVNELVMQNLEYKRKYQVISDENYNLKIEIQNYFDKIESLNSNNQLSVEDKNGDSALNFELITQIHELEREVDECITLLKDQSNA
jgi:hypothetical protein